jgi:dihydrofolate synthase/folylpolyglutamate synthase
MNYRDAIGFLYGLQTFGIKLGLRNITNVLQEIGNPHKHFRTIHVAGTNGKGSTAALLESVLRTAGYQTGLYTSPHLFDFSERIRVNGSPIPRRKVSKGVDLLKPYIERYRCTFFEAATALAFHHFSQEEVDVAIVEVGLGGRLDATNILSPLCTIITDIDHDHTEYLGHTLKQIAQEKAAVIKKHGTIITSVNDPEILKILQTVSRKQEAALYPAAEHCTFRAKEMTSEGSRVDIQTPFHSYEGLRLSLPGEHQLRNLSAAILTLDLLSENGLPIRRKNVRDGVAGTIWPGRLQVLQRKPLFIVDGAHNPAGMRALKEALKGLFTYEHLILILGIMENKKYTEMVHSIVPIATHTIVTRPKMDRALNLQTLAQEVRTISNQVETTSTVSRAVKRAFQLAGPNDAVCAAGSLFLVGEIVKSKFGRANELFGLQ